MTVIPVQLCQRLVRFILTGVALGYAVAFSIGGLHLAGFPDSVLYVIAVPLAAIAVFIFVREFRARSGDGTLTVVGGEIKVERKGRTFFRVSTDQLQIEFGAFVHTGSSGTGNPTRGSWNGPAIRLSSPRSKRKLTAVSTWQSLRVCGSQTSVEAPRWANESFRVASQPDIRLEGEAWDRLQEVLGIGDAPRS